MAEALPTSFMATLLCTESVRFWIIAPVPEPRSTMVAIGPARQGAARWAVRHGAGWSNHTHRYLARTETDGRTVVCVLTHDPKFDVPLLVEALHRPLGYLGALGSRRTNDERCRRLREAGLTDAEISRLRAPIGLDLGARTPEETAVSIAAEIVALRRSGSGRLLASTDGPIHHESEGTRKSTRSRRDEQRGGPAARARRGPPVSHAQGTGRGGRSVLGRTGLGLG